MRLLSLLCQVLSSVHITNAGFRVLGHWFLDGSDTDISLHNGATYTSSGGVAGNYRAIKFTKDKSYATTPAINLTNRNFTIACWIKIAMLENSRQTIYSNWRFKPRNFALYVKRDSLQFVYHKVTNDTIWSCLYVIGGKVRQERWTHVAVTVNRSLREGAVYVDAKKMASDKYSENDRFYNTTGNTFDIGDNGHWTDEQLFGEVMDLYVLDQALSQQQIGHLKDTKTGSQLFHSVSVGFSLQSHVFQTENNVTECLRCMFLCRLHEECVSFNFNRGDQICELNDATQAADPANHKPRAGFVYYEQSN